jgi:hypothetical protein
MRLSERLLLAYSVEKLVVEADNSHPEVEHLAA